MIKKYVSFYDFCDSFSDTYKDNFSYHGKRALYDYLEQLSDDMGEDIELDTVALCCEYSEYDTALEAYKDHHTGTLDIEGDEDEMEEQAMEWLQDNTQVITYSEPAYDIDIKGSVIRSGVIIAQF